MEDFKKLADSELELVSGGMTVDYTLNAYCPYHMCSHAGVQRMQESYVVNGNAYPTFYCPDARLYFFEAKNGWFDSYGNVLVKKG